MFKRLARSPVIPFIGGTLIWAYMCILSHTLRWRVEGADNARKLWTGPEGWVAATWHSRILLMPVLQIIWRPKWTRPPHPATLMVSTSRDGEFTNRAGRLLGLHIIRGSAATKKGKDKRGMAAAREAMEVLKKGGGVVLTIDGPKGPAEVVGIGGIKLAQQMEAPILIYGLSANAKRLNSWDRLLFPKPFARGAMVIPPPIPTSKDMDSEDLRQRVERALKEATARADELAGLPQDSTPVSSSMSTATSSSQPKAAERTETAMEHGGP
ncbi:MAG TPA: lysophospholipid acyltransferase family protein [Hyphomonadaceae bacterium]|nr:lysophospholipid acyltransferase family protein [Hyphomonadaceae bacterium]